jgi:DNA-binding response OmpR family regulator
MTRLLLLDDDPSTLGFLALMLGRDGYDVRTATSGSQAVEIGASFEPHILIADWLLGQDGSGLEAARDLIARLPRLAIVFVSGLEPEELSVQSAGLPVRSILQKPLDFAALRRCLA